MRNKAMYTVQASYERDGQIIDCSEAETLGEASGVEYATEAEAIEACDAAQEGLAGLDLDPSTTCSVYRGRVQVYCAS